MGGFIIHHHEPVTARSLLLLYLDIRNHELRQCSERKLAESEFSHSAYRLVQIRQLDALFRAFGLGWNPEYFEEGKFINHDHPKYAAVLQTLCKETDDRVDEMFCDESKLQWLYRTLFEYRLLAQPLLSFANGVLEASGIYLYAYEKTGDISSAIHDKLNDIEALLTELISPEGKTFTVQQLIRDYEFPTEDLSDDEWRY
jgi:hypothetical protein